jgi:hypothetical protein
LPFLAQGAVMAIEDALPAWAESCGLRGRP